MSGLIFAFRVFLRIDAVLPLDVPAAILTFFVLIFDVLLDLDLDSHSERRLMPLCDYYEIVDRWPPDLCGDLLECTLLARLVCVGRM